MFCGGHPKRTTEDPDLCRNHKHLLSHYIQLLRVLETLSISSQQTLLRPERVKSRTDEQASYYCSRNPTLLATFATAQVRED